MMLKPIPEFPEYLVQEDGKVWSNKSSKFLAAWTNNKNRLLVTLSINGHNKHVQVSRLVAYVYGIIPSLTCDLEVDHKDRDSSNNHYSNLQGLTTADHLSKTLADKGHIAHNKTCITCGKILTVSQPKTGYCKACEPIKGSDITIADIEYWVSKYSWVRASKELGLSDNGLRNRYKNLTGLDPKKLKSLLRVGQGVKSPVS